MKAWNVYYMGHLIDTVFYDADIDGETVRKSLINHDGHDAGITVEEDNP